jgi:hypothetical protein
MNFKLFEIENSAKDTKVENNGKQLLSALMNLNPI